MTQEHTVIGFGWYIQRLVKKCENRPGANLPPTTTDRERPCVKQAGKET